jgi:hypothetical protein
MTFDQILFGMSGFIMLAIAVGVVIIVTRWQDAREERRRPGKATEPHRS